MNRLLLFLGVLLTSMCLNAAPVSEGAARRKAERFMLRRTDAGIGKGAVNVRARKTARTQPYYIFNTADGGGFVIVSGDDRLPAVVGYSTEGAWPEDENCVPDALKVILERYGAYVEAVQDGKAVDLMSVRQDNNPRIIVAPLLTTKWGQSYPYNKYAPECTDTAFVRNHPDYNGRFPIGCAAVALGQIINYWKDKGAPLHPQDRNTTVTWLNDGVKFSEVKHLSSATTYDYANIPDSIFLSPELSGMSDDRWGVCSDAVGVFLRDIAYSVNMNWTPGGGGGANPFACEGAAVMGMGMSYDARTYQSAFFDGKLDNPEWWRLIQEDLDNGMPIFYGGAAKGAPNAGHAFVFDGYDSNHFVHVNWGWSGKCNNWFDINFLKTDMYDLNVDDSFDFAWANSMIHNLHPRAEGEVQTLSEEKFCIDQLSVGGQLSQWKFGVQDRNLTLYTIVPTAFQGQTGLEFDYSLVLADSAMNTIRVVDEYDSLISSLVKDSTVITPSFTVARQLKMFDDDLPDGIYHVYPMMRGYLNGECTDWFRPVVADCPGGVLRFRLKGNDVASFPEEYDRYYHEPSFSKHVDGLSVDLHVFFNEDPLNLQADSVHDVNMLVDFYLNGDYVPDDLDADYDLAVLVVNDENEVVSRISYPRFRNMTEDVVLFGAGFVAYNGALSAELSLSPGKYTLIVEDEILGIDLEYPLVVKDNSTGVGGPVLQRRVDNASYSVQGIRVANDHKGVVINGGKVYLNR